MVKTGTYLSTNQDSNPARPDLGVERRGDVGLREIVEMHDFLLRRDREEVRSLAQKLGLRRRSLKDLHPISNRPRGTEDDNEPWCCRPRRAWPL